MAISVTTDLVDISNCDTLTTNGQFYRLNGPSASNPDVTAAADSRRQGVACVGFKSGTSITPTDTGGHFNATANFDVTNQHVFHWRNSVTVSNTTTKANRGLAFGLTNTSTTSTTAWSTTNFKLWLLDGSDTDIQGGWVPYVVNPAGTADVSAGTLTLNAVRNCAFISRQATTVNTGTNNILVDAIRRGTGITATCNSAADVIDFNSIYSVDTTLTNAWGILNQYNGIYYPIGTMRIGATNQTNTCLFRDTNQTLVWRNLPVSTNLYTFDVRGAASFPTTFQLGLKSGTSTSAGCVISGLGTAVWNITADANSIVDLYSSTFNRLGTATLTAASEIIDCVFNNSGSITTNGAVITSCGFTAHTATQLIIQNPTQMAAVTNSTFTSGGTGHAIQINTSSASPYEFSNLNFVGYAATNGSTGNEAIFINVLSGTVTINYAGGTLPTYRLVAGSTATVVVSSSSTLKLTNIVPGSEVRVYLGTIANAGSALEIGGNENLTGTEFTLVHSYGGQNGYVQIINFDYQTYFQALTPFGSSGIQEIIVNQVTDRVARNP